MPSATEDGGTSDGRLNIPGRRRLAGIALMALAYVASIAVFFRVEYAAFSSVGVDGNVSVASFLFAVYIQIATMCLTPFVFYPCLFDRFPGWVARYVSPEKLRKIAREYFGVNV